MSDTGTSRGRTSDAVTPHNTNSGADLNTQELASHTALGANLHTGARSTGYTNQAGAGQALPCGSAGPTTDPANASLNQSSDAPAAGLSGQENPADGAMGADTQDRFAERFPLFMAQLEDACNAENVEVAVAIVCDPKISQGPLIMTRGSIYEVGKLLARLLRRIKAKIDEDLEA